MYLFGMTKLKELINNIPAESKFHARVIIGEKIGVKESTIRSMANGNRKISAEKATELAKFFNIKRSDLRPDIFND